MEHFESSRFDTFLSISYLGWVIQNILLLFSLFYRSGSNSINTPLFNIAMSLDLFFILIIAIIGLLKFLKTQASSRSNWLIITLGSLLFIYFSLLWRVNLEVLYPTIQKPLANIIPSITNSSQSSLDALVAIIYAIRVSNIGLFLISLGLFFEYKHVGNYRYIVLLYGIANLISVVYFGLLFIKFLTPILLIPYLIKISINPTPPEYEEIF